MLDLADGSLLVDKQPGDSGAVLGTWVAISKGTFTMGSPPDEPCRDSDEAQHLVNLTHDFELQETEVTQGQFFALMDYNPSANSCSPSASCPVETVSWHESAAYCNELSSGTGKDQCYTCTGSGASVSCQQATAYSGQNLYNCPGYRLPTEAEWEYAYRAGTITAYYIGASDPAVCNLCSLMDANADMIGWYCANSANNAHPVKQKQPNAWGLHDMAGNIWEWCNDWYQSNLGSGSATDPSGATGGSYRVLRGGAWDLDADNMRAANRSLGTPTVQNGHIGFRCARTL